MTIRRPGRYVGSANLWAVAFQAVSLVAAVLWAHPQRAAAQDSTGTLLVKVYRLPDSVPLPGAFIRSGRAATVTDEGGLARLDLATRLWSVTVSHPTYQTSTFEMTILPNVSQTADIYLRSRDDDAHRSTRPDEPLARRRYDPAAIVRAVQRSSGDLLGLFWGGGARVQPAGGPLDATSLRIRGIPGNRAAIFVDGFPLHGGRVGEFGLLQVGPIDLEGGELVSGASSALYGPLAGAGALGLTVRRPDRDRVRLGVNQSSEKGGDVVFWGARRFSPTAAGTLGLDFHQQRLVDADDDGWGEFPRAIRLSIRPRVYLDRPNGDGMMLAAGVSSEDRTGGFLTAATDPNPYREERRTGRADVAFEAHRLDGRGGRLETRAALGFQSTSHRFDALRERDRRYLAFGEARYLRPLGRSTLLVGGAFQYESLRQRDLPQFDYTHQFPSIFGQLGVPISTRLVGSISGRCDRHNVHGIQCMPRASLLVRASQTIDARLSLASGYFSPTPLSDEVETIGLHGTVPVAAKAERIRTASLDLTATEDRFSFAASFNYSRIALPVRLIPFEGDAERRLRLINVADPTRVFAGELSGDYRGDDIAVRAFYGYTNGTEGVPGGSGRRDLELSPRHTVGVSLNWRPTIPAEPSATFELSYLGPQSVHDNPYLSRTPGYPLANGVASLRSGRARLYLNGENLFDKKLRGYHPVLLPAPVEGGRRTPAPWAPLRGRVISIGALVDW